MCGLKPFTNVASFVDRIRYCTVSTSTVRYRTSSFLGQWVKYVVCFRSIRINPENHQRICSSKTAAYVTNCVVHSLLEKDHSYYFSVPGFSFFFRTTIEVNWSYRYGTVQFSTGVCYRKVRWWKYAVKMDTSSILSYLISQTTKIYMER